MEMPWNQSIFFALMLEIRINGENEYYQSAKVTSESEGKAWQKNLMQEI